MKYHIDRPSGIFRSLFDESCDAILLFEGNTVVDCNAAAERLLSCRDKEQILGTTFASLSPRKQPGGQFSSKKARDAIATALQKTTHRFTWTLKKFGGGVFSAEVTMTAIPSKGRDLFYVVLRDTTTWKKAEKASLRAKHEIEERVKERTSDLAALNQQLLEEIRIRKEKATEKFKEELSHLSEHLERAREIERTHIAREVHDELGQSLSALKIDVTCLGESLPESHGFLREQTKAMAEKIDGAIQAVRRICSELRPPILEHFGLPAAIEWYLEDFQKRASIRCMTEIDPEISKIEKELATILFRIFQEAMTNILRHAGATTVKVVLKNEAHHLVLKVVDNGRGISKEEISSPRSFGIIGIRERVRFWGGQSAFVGIPNKGTTVTISIPLDRLKGSLEQAQRQPVSEGQERGTV
jgi:signal transduction histidine kinase